MRCGGWHAPCVACGGWRAVRLITRSARRPRIWAAPCGPLHLETDAVWRTFGAQGEVRIAGLIGNSWRAGRDAARRGGCLSRAHRSDARVVGGNLFVAQVRDAVGASTCAGKRGSSCSRGVAKFVGR